MFRSYVNPTLEQVVNLVLTVPSAITEVHQCLGKCLAALITSIGPELQGEHQFYNNHLVNVFDKVSERLGGCPRVVFYSHCSTRCINGHW